MKKTLLFAAIGLTICAGFNACNKADDDSAQADEQLKQQIVGKWKTCLVDNVEPYTNEKSVQTFSADGKYTSTFLYSTVWALMARQGTFTIKDKVLTTSTDVSTISSFASFNNGELIQDTYKMITENQKLLSVEDTLPFSFPNISAHFKRVTNDFSKSIIGLWEGVSLDAQYQTYGDANHRWRYNADGTYEYYSKSGSKWVLDTGTGNSVYFLDGDFLGSRWEGKDGITTECWDIDFCNDSVMQWSALRKSPYPFTAVFKMKKITQEGPEM